MGELRPLVTGAARRNEKERSDLSAERPEREPPGELRPIVTGQLSGMKRSAATSPLSAWDGGRPTSEPPVSAEPTGPRT